MKTRQGFISNSSSTSFCIYGKGFNATDAALDADRLKVDACKLGLNFHWGPPYSDAFYIGRDLTTIGDSETGSDFKETVIQKLTTLGVDNPTDCSFIEMGWYDG